MLWRVKQKVHHLFSLFQGVAMRRPLASTAIAR